MRRRVVVRVAWRSVMEERRVKPYVRRGGRSMES